MQPIAIQPVGVVHSAVKEAIVDNWGQVISEIHIDEDLKEGLRGLDDWSHIVVIFYMHETRFEKTQNLIQKPRNRDDMPPLGIFAQRSRNHPNTIGISAVRLLGIEGHVIKVKGLDAIDGTPVLDIKPYAPVYDGASDPLVPAWFVRLMQGYF